MNNAIFKNKILVVNKLQPFGFVADERGYVYSVPLVDGQFNLVVRITTDGLMAAKIYDTDTEDEYTLHLSSQAVGAFVGRVRAEYEEVLQKIADNCFETQIFKTEYADKIIRYIREKYQEEFEFLWEKFPDNAIVRRKDTQKWYVALLTVAAERLGLSGTDKIEIIDVRMKTEEVAVVVDGRKYFSGYHMNKKHWVTLCLDNSVSFEEICRRIDDSRQLAGR